jgi:hypothetical protein
MSPTTIHQKTEAKDIFLVKDPLSGKHYNMMPLFYQLNEQWYCKDGPTDMARKIQEVLDYMCTSVLVNKDTPCAYGLQEINNLNMILIHLRRAFEDMTDI